MKNNIVVVFSSHLSEEENNKFVKHIGDTIGARHKVVCYPNFNQYSLPQVYNLAIKDHYEKDTKGKIHGSGGAAELLGINPNTLRNRMNKLGINYKHRS